jgi:hypothetical protein
MSFCLPLHNIDYTTGLMLCSMGEGIYVQLLEEGTQVYRFVPALPIGDGSYQLQGHDLYDPEDEVWEFTPGTLVRAQLKDLTVGPVLVAVEKLPNKG